MWISILYVSRPLSYVARMYVCTHGVVLIRLYKRSTFYRLQMWHCGLLFNSVSRFCAIVSFYRGQFISLHALYSNALPPSVRIYADRLIVSRLCIYISFSNFQALQYFRMRVYFCRPEFYLQSNGIIKFIIRIIFNNIFTSLWRCANYHVGGKCKIHNLCIFTCSPVKSVSHATHLAHRSPLE